MGDEILDEEECSIIIQALEPVAHRWYEIGLVLGLTPNCLDRLKALAIGESDFTKLLTSMIVEWLKMSYNTVKFGKPTWRRLVEAVRASTGGRNPALADKLEKKYCIVTWLTQPALATPTSSVTPTSPATETTQISPEEQMCRCCCCVGQLRRERDCKISDGRVEFSRKEVAIPRAFTAPNWDKSLESSKNIVLAHPTWEIQEITQQEGYWGALTGKEAEDHLRSCGNNCYLIRYSQKQEKYVISVMRTDAEPAIQHYQVCIRKDNDNPTYEIEGTEEWFLSVTELLRFYQKTPLTRSNRTIGEVCVK